MLAVVTLFAHFTVTAAANAVLVSNFIRMYLPIILVNITSYLVQVLLPTAFVTLIAFQSAIAAPTAQMALPAVNVNVYFLSPACKCCLLQSLLIDTYRQHLKNVKWPLDCYAWNLWTCEIGFCSCRTIV